MLDSGEAVRVKLIPRLDAAADVTPSLDKKRKKMSMRAPQKLFNINDVE